MYPFASQTPKDFDNILSIYLDAVFNPICMIDKKPFLQEGWHLELNSKDELPQYKGVVYNEMKGAMSSVDEVLVQSTLEAMYKDTFYRFNSGGDPDVIPELTYEDFKEFHSKYYHPTNSYIFIYGDCDMEERLNWLDEAYLSNFAKIEFDTEIIVEKFIEDAREFNVAVLGDANFYEVSDIDEPIKNNEVLTFVDKYLSGDAKNCKAKGSMTHKLNKEINLSEKNQMKIVEYDIDYVK